MEGYFEGEGNTKCHPGRKAERGSLRKVRQVGLGGVHKNNGKWGNGKFGQKKDAKISWGRGHRPGKEES